MPWPDGKSHDAVPTELDVRHAIIQLSNDL